MPPVTVSNTELVEGEMFSITLFPTTYLKLSWTAWSAYSETGELIAWHHVKCTVLHIGKLPANAGLSHSKTSPFFQPRNRSIRLDLLTQTGLGR